MNLRQLISRAPRPGAPALDLSEARVAALTAEVEYLRGELSDMQQRVDEVLDRESMCALTPRMECLTTAASIDRFGASRARHLPVPAVETTAAALGLAVSA
ncbi:hypothetical protein [Nocardia tengchongensis]|uniref:hypothetical protein n=1 Tax=Nocardia tengchongensis TaxID=2055889 RepID=UPI0036ABE4D7